jgi:hypothetical protein
VISPRATKVQALESIPASNTPLDVHNTPREVPNWEH